MNKSRLNNTLLTLGSLHDAQSKATIAMSVGLNLDWCQEVRRKEWALPITSISHRQSGRASTVFGLNNLVTAELDTYRDEPALMLNYRQLEKENECQLCTHA